MVGAQTRATANTCPRDPGPGILEPRSQAQGFLTGRAAAARIDVRGARLPKEILELSYR